MPDRDGPRSNPYKPNPELCCEACVFGRGEHSTWCFKSLPGGIQADCEYCPPGECGDFEAIGMLAGRYICSVCLILTDGGTPHDRELHRIDAGTPHDHELHRMADDGCPHDV